MRKFLVADFEFTVYTKPTGRPRGFFSEILEFGWLLLDEQGEFTDIQDQAFVRPRFYPKQATEGQEFSMITQADLAGGIEYEEMITRLKTVYQSGQSYFIAWGDADWQVIQEACNRYKVENPLCLEDYLDLSLAYKDYFQLNYRPSLKNALTEQSIQLDGFWHTALDDARNTAKLVQHMLKTGWQPV